MNLLPYMEQWNMLPPKGGSILCGVSGGRDSICLLHYLHRLAPVCGFTVAAAHLNHLMRQTAQRDVDFVRAFCEERGIPFYLSAEPIYERAAEWNVSVEEAGRRARYAFLERTADEIGASRIATAHHQNDQAETVILNLLRGTGPEGLAGIPPVRGHYIRPLLDTPRTEIEAYLAEYGLGHVEDETNQDTDYARNRLRLTLWPQLAEINGALTEHIAAAAAIERRENDYLNALAEEYLPSEGTQLCCDTLRRAPEVLRSRMIRLLLARLPSGKKDVGAVHIEALLHLAETGGTLPLPGHMAAVCRDGVLSLSMVPEPPVPQRLTEGTMLWGDYRITVSRQKPVSSEDGTVFALGCHCESAELSVRSWRGSDRLALPSGRGSRSLKRLFADVGMAPEERSMVPVICVGGDPAAVYGVGTDQRYLPDEEQNHTIYIQIIKNTKE